MATKLKSGTHETHRECRACKMVKPLNLEHFPRHDTCANGFNRRCIKCTQEYKRAWKVAHGERLRHPLLHEASHEARTLRSKPKHREGKMCRVCFDQPHRRSRFGGCWLCSKPFEPLPPIELITHKYYDVAW